MLKSIKLSKNWEFSQVVSASWSEVVEDWNPCSLPTSVHVELRRLGRIPDPHKDLAEWDVQWIQEADWTFRTTFDVVLKDLQKQTDLICEGLDTYCEIELNGKTIATTDNMFVSHRIDVNHDLVDGSNCLVLKFKAPWLAAKAEEKANGGPRELWNGDSCRLYSRKAQYGWGWDWGPILMTVGPWKPIRLETYTCRIDNVRLDADLAGVPDFSTPTLSGSCEVVCAGQSGGPKGELHVTLRTNVGRGIKRVVTKDTTFKFELQKGDVEAWWPVKYGSQPLYEVELQWVDQSGRVVASSTHKTAFRHVEVVQDHLIDQPGTTFLFEVNGVRIFCGGSNWIPADTFLTEISPERYRKWIDLMVDGNQNMLRIWGGGAYEDEALYDACDERGVLVWQDFMFGCGIYPSYPKLNESVENEARQVVKRLREHPSVVIFAGNNEDYQVAESLGYIDYSDDSGDYMHTKFPARHIYENILPQVVKQESTIFYHRGSPYGGKDSRDPTVGDIHQWNVWHGTQEPWSKWSDLSGRFISEFGMQAYPDLRTVRSFFSSPNPTAKGAIPADFFPQSRIMVNHNKAAGFERRLELYLMENFRHAFDMESYTYYTQIMQAEALGAAYRLWRREWKGRGREYVAGALVWQLNDCWPCVSWSVADYFLRPKPSYFVIARELKPYTVGLLRRETTVPRDDTTASFFTIKDEAEMWACNSTTSPKSAIFELSAFHLVHGLIHTESFPIVLAPNSSTEIWAGQIPGQPVRTSLSQGPEPIVLHARLVDTADKSVLARYSNWPEPYKYLKFPDPKLVVEVGEDGESVRVTCESPVKGLVLDVEEVADGTHGAQRGERKECRWSDQAIDLVPGDEQVVRAVGLGGRKIKTRYLGDGSA